MRIEAENNRRVEVNPLPAGMKQLRIISPAQDVIAGLLPKEARQVSLALWSAEDAVPDRVNVDNMLRELVELRAAKQLLQDQVRSLTAQNSGLAKAIDARPALHAPVSGIPQTLFLGLGEEGDMIEVFDNSISARLWISADPARRKLYRAAVDVLAECGFIPPADSRLEEKPVPLREVR